MMNDYISIQYLRTIIEKMQWGTLSNIKIENWNETYEAFDFVLNGIAFKSRLAKKTPKKQGYFVAVWQKNKENKNVPFKYNESQDKIIINVIEGAKNGQFVFPKSLLLEKGILSSDHTKGKMAFRVYPCWEKALNATALRTQKWQAPYFIDLSEVTSLETIQQIYLNEPINK
ncbi:MepB family protein [Staphylococcus ratti]|uniref:MepB family protein n=1 Tax=Staphylococcus ratti TaxID=2892440 RepID=A0ABY3PC71_9STAP|nr:MepB family protein [Staphylococcus ratti]UEX89906.1 MepB family protein [Staphylococcus ratti]